MRALADPPIAPIASRFRARFRSQTGIEGAADVNGLNARVRGQAPQRKRGA